jgi:hypothetical protein
LSNWHASQQIKLGITIFGNFKKRIAQRRKLTALQKDKKSC